MNITDNTSTINWDSIIVEEKTIPSDLSLHLEKAYLIDQYMSHIEWSDGNVLYGSSVKQLTILDQDLNPIIINIDRLGDWTC